MILVSCLKIDIACNVNHKYYQNDQLLDTMCCVRSILKTSLRPITILQDNVWKSTLMQYSKIDIANIIGNVKNIVNRHLSTLHSKTFVKVEIEHRKALHCNVYFFIANILQYDLRVFRKCFNDDDPLTNDRNSLVPFNIFTNP